MEQVEDFDAKGMFDRLTICVDKLSKPQTSRKRRIRYRKLAQALIKELREEMEE